MPSLCIVGAGAAGLAAAHALRSSDIRVTVIDKSRGLSGRAATRWRDVPAANGSAQRWVFDHGAQYVSPEPGSAADRLIRDEIPSDDLFDIRGAIWPFDNAGALHPENSRPESAPRLTYPQGMAELGRRLVGATPGLTVKRTAHASRLVRDADGWTVETLTGERLGPFDAVLLTPPAPQSAAIVAASHLGSPHAEVLEKALEAATFRSQFAIVLGFDKPVKRPDAYALVNSVEDGKPSHDVAWLAFESDKPERAPARGTLIVMQMSSAWTLAHYDDPKDILHRHGVHAAEALLGSLPEPLWMDTQRWRYALPDVTLDRAAIEAVADIGLFFAGDALAGQGRVHLALEEGIAVAERIASALA